MVESLTNLLYFSLIRQAWQVKIAQNVLIQILRHTTARFVKRFKTEASILGGGGGSRPSPMKVLGGGKHNLIIDNMQCKNSSKAPSCSTKPSNLTKNTAIFNLAARHARKVYNCEFAGKARPFFFFHLSNVAPPPPTPIQKKGSTPLS